MKAPRLAKSASAQLIALSPKRQLEDLVAVISPDQIRDLVDPLLADILARIFLEARADEGTLWLIDHSRNELSPIWNNGPNAARFAGHITQSLGSGLISMVATTEQPFLENQVRKNLHQDRTIDETLGLRTESLIAVPLHFLRRCRGVLSCVQLGDRTSRKRCAARGFSIADLEVVQHGSALVTCLFEHRLFSQVLGWK